MDLFAGSSSKPAPKALTVTQLLRRMKNLLEVQIGELWIEGEVSNLRKQGSGHWYFSLKDEGAQISCAMFGARKRPGSDAIEDGAKVRLFAEATIYEARGQLQVIVIKAERAGMGDLQARFEALKRKLDGEGLFDATHKKPIPGFPRRIGLVTSGSGAALQDILNVLGRRAPWVQPVLFPVRVQGRGAEREIAEAIRRMGRPEDFNLPRCDVLIVGRGGGSIEDLWNFNEEIVARAIFDCPIPIISAVGHEIDFTIADFVADLRAPTPSAAAELAVADGVELTERLGQLRKRMVRRVVERVERARLSIDSLRRGPLRRDGSRLLREPVMRLDALRSALASGIRESFVHASRRLQDAKTRHHLHQPAKVIERRLENLAQLRIRLGHCVSEDLGRRSERLVRFRSLLRTLGPESAFQRGFSLTLGPDGRAVKSAAALKPGDLLRTKFAEGEVTSRVEDA
ncbi:MAG: exodeoxyribonuclease VII large subunit [Verrucomicrobiae bacterium]|nr:exodeoxyribonuclease VII large subunit [Verrucomicrobiae bacterium]MCP5543003.1 exodeoxyribonuclease VII large subunit [Akkermansiaceae bacterium]MCP5547705.1 exodeoxyribonuclease VII large subunit [Akkermansiaceae bacterium]